MKFWFRFSLSLEIQRNELKNVFNMYHLNTIYNQKIDIKVNIKKHLLS